MKIVGNQIIHEWKTVNWNRTSNSHRFPDTILFPRKKYIEVAFALRNNLHNKQIIEEINK